MDQRKRKLLTIRKTLYATNVDRLYVLGKEEGRKLLSIEDRVDT